MNELDAARQVRDGLLPSPYPLGGMTLFALRITGTGLSYRSGHDEFVWRDSSIYLNDEFLARCNGLPVIWEHPEKKPALDSREYNDRSIGTVMLPYIKGDEVWGVCRLYDADAITLMTSGQLSTSPSVVFGPADGNEKVELNGVTFLIEGDPKLLDHLAVCAAGVWDKGRPPDGIQNDALPQQPTDERSDTMAESETEKKEREEREAEARKDSSAKLDAIADSVARMHSRMDAMEAEKAAGDARKDAAEKARADAAARRDAARKDRFGARKDGESYKDWQARHDADEAAMCDALEKGGSEKDGARKDAKDCRADSEASERKDGGESFEKWAKEEGGEPEHKDDAKKDAKVPEHKDDARHDAQEQTIANLTAALTALQGQMQVITAPTTIEDRNALAQAQSRADGIAGLFGTRALPQTPGENPLEYRRRLANEFKRHSPKFKTKSLAGLDADMLEMAEEQIYADAAAASRAPDRAGAGILIPIVEIDPAGRQITRYTGDNLAWMAPFMTGGQVGRIIRFNQRGV